MIKPKDIIILIGTALISVLGFLIWSRITYSVGYPLDDAWIHQTFARNLAQYGQWAFIKGQLSGGSTSPLWTLLLSIGYLLRLPHLIWTFFIGVFALIGVGYFSELILRSIKLIEVKNIRLPFLGVIIVTEWHLVWAALSGMETILLTLMIVMAAYFLVKEKQNWLIIGIFVGISLWIRPEGLTMLGPIFVLAFHPQNIKLSIKQYALVFAGLVLFLVPYLIFNHYLNGAIWPSTFFAKQAEYAVLRDTPIQQRFLKLAVQMVVGTGAILLPGFIYSCVQMMQTRDKWRLSFLAWIVGFILLYALRLPVTYQHARYLIPVFPIFLILSFSGLTHLLRLHMYRNQTTRIAFKAWLSSFLLVVVIFYLIGGNAYAEDVAIIESEMVTAAIWVSENLPEHTLVAAHDIGALGYYGGREILDLAGLINPEVIKFIRDEEMLLKYMQHRGAKYLFTFPRWYPLLVQHGDLIFSTQGPFSPQFGGENIAIYKLKL